MERAAGEKERSGGRSGVCNIISQRQMQGQRSRGCQLPEEVNRLEGELTSSEEGEVDSEDDPMRGSDVGLQGSR